MDRKPRNISPLIQQLSPCFIVLPDVHLKALTEGGIVTDDQTNTDIGGAETIERTS